MLLNAVPMAMPRAVPAGPALPQPETLATASSAAIQRGLVRRARRNWNGSWPAATASSSTIDSTAKVLIDAPTERQKPTGIGAVWLTHSTCRAPKLYGRACEASEPWLSPVGPSGTPRWPRIDGETLR